MSVKYRHLIVKAQEGLDSSYNGASAWKSGFKSQPEEERENDNNGRLIN